MSDYYQIKNLGANKTSAIIETPAPNLFTPDSTNTTNSSYFNNLTDVNPSDGLPGYGVALITIACLTGGTVGFIGLIKLKDKIERMRMIRDEKKKWDNKDNKDTDNKDTENVDTENVRESANKADIATAYV